MFSSKKYKDRLAVIAYIKRSFPREFILDIMGKGLTDKSSLIRCYAAIACGDIGLNELFPLLESKLSIESDSDVLRYLRCSIGILKDGYYLDYSSGRPLLSVKNTQHDNIKQYFIKQEEIEKDGLLEIVKRFKNKP